MALDSTNQFLYSVNVNGTDIYLLEKEENDQSNKRIVLTMGEEPLNYMRAAHLYAAPVGTRFMVVTINKYEKHTSRLLASWLFEDCFLEETNNSVNSLKVALVYRTITTRKN